MKKILVLRGGALGDFIVTLPALRLLRERWPAAQIEFVGNVRAAELGAMSGLLDATHSQHEARWAGLYGTAPLASDFQTWMNTFDLIVSYWPDPAGDLQRCFAHRGTSFIASHAAVNTRTRPAAAHFCDALAPLGLSTSDYAMRLQFPPAAVAEADERLGVLQHFLAIHPGSGSPKKNWPLERWSEFVARCVRPLLVITGKAGHDMQPRPPAHAMLRRAHNWPLPVLGAALARCSLFIGHDSGISHLAAAAGARCVLLFGPTDPAVWAPPGAQVIQRGADLVSISVTDVWAASNTPPAPARPDR